MFFTSDGAIVGVVGASMTSWTSNIWVISGIGVGRIENVSISSGRFRLRLCRLWSSENWIVGVGSRGGRTNKSQGPESSVVIGLFFRFCFRLRQSHKRMGVLPPTPFASVYNSDYHSVNSENKPVGIFWHSSFTLTGNDWWSRQRWWWRNKWSWIPSYHEKDELILNHCLAGRGCKNDFLSVQSVISPLKELNHYQDAASVISRIL